MKAKTDEGKIEFAPNEAKPAQPEVGKVKALEIEPARDGAAVVQAIWGRFQRGRVLCQK